MPATPALDELMLVADELVVRSIGYVAAPTDEKKAAMLLARKALHDGIGLLTARVTEARS